VSPDDAANGYFNTFSGEDPIQVTYTRRDEGTFHYPGVATFTRIVETIGSGRGEGDAQVFLDPQGGVYSVSFHPYAIEVKVREWTEISDDAEAELQKGCDSGLILPYCMVLQQAEETIRESSGSVPGGDINDHPLPVSGNSLSGTENMDDGTAFTWSVSACGGDAPTIEVDRATWNDVVFDKSDKENKAEVFSIANKVSQEDATRVVWSFPEILGVRLTTDPENAMGQYVTVTYSTMPENNSDFEVDEPVTVRLPGCTGEATDKAPARFFFNLTGASNPDPKPVPNWFYYWLQTSAGQGLSRGQVRYSLPGECQDNSGETFGFYRPGDTDINLCDPITGSLWNKVTGLLTDGIDTYATTILHELEHLRQYDEWWRDFDETWSEGGERSNEYAAQRKNIDRDDDGIPDRFEEGLGMNPKWQDTHKCKMTDAHYYAWLAGSMWRNAAADKEDWAAPGKQYGEQSAPPNTLSNELCGIAKTGSPQR
jgi:hypothetical protein